MDTHDSAWLRGTYIDSIDRSRSACDDAWNSFSSKAVHLEPKDELAEGQTAWETLQGSWGAFAAVTEMCLVVASVGVRKQV